MHMCERQAGTRSMHIQCSYNINMSILLVSLLHVRQGRSGLLLFIFFKEMFLHLFELFFHTHRDEELYKILLNKCMFCWLED